MQEGCFHGETCHQRLRSEPATLGGNGAGWAAQGHPVKEAETCCWSRLHGGLGRNQVSKGKKTCNELPPHPDFPGHCLLTGNPVTIRAGHSAQIWTPVNLPGGHTPELPVASQAQLCSKPCHNLLTDYNQSISSQCAFYLAFPG